MPTRFTANALSITVTDTLSATGIYHSSAWINYPQKLRDKELELARLLETPVTVTTLDHLCISLTGTREDHHGIFWGLAHSCVVIDEADFYDDFTQRNLVTLLHALRLLNVRVLVMSATVPESARVLYGESGSLAEKIHEDLSDADRVRCRIKHAGKSAAPEDIEPLLERALNGESTIIYANTVKRAQDYRRWFQERDFDNVILYHSRFTEPDKVKIEEQLREMLGVDAWENGTQQGVAILTQIGELSVNISADLMISDLCPIDRLAQRVGRLSRFDKNVVGELFLIEPQRFNKNGEKEFYPAPYGHFENGNGWQSTPILEQSREWLIEGEYSARRFVNLVNALYPDVPPPAPHVRDNQTALHEHIVYHWLIVPKAETKQDDDQTLRWKSRDIAPQFTVYADCNSSTVIDASIEEMVFRSRMKFREWAQNHAIQIQIYEIKNAEQSGALEKIFVMVGEDTEEIWTVRPNFYSKTFGLQLQAQSDELEVDDE
jgi:CRISPR-associated endonuclease/helicase Cas3